MKRNEIETVIIGTGKICLLNADLTQDRPLATLIFMIMTLSVSFSTTKSDPTVAGPERHWIRGGPWRVAGSSPG